MNFGFIQGRMSTPPSNKILQYFPYKNWKKEFSLAKKHGFKFIEYFAERDYNKKNPIWNLKKLNTIKKLTKKNNLYSISFCDDFFISKNILTYKNLNNYYNTLTKNLSVIKVRLYILALFEKSVINKSNFKNYAEIIRNISDKLKKKKIKLLLETNLDVISFKKLMKLIDRKNVYLVYDTGNRLKKKNMQHDEIIKLKKFISHFHLKDKNWKGKNVIMGTGSVNFKYIFEAIKKIKFKGNFVFETNRGENPIKTMINNKKYILNIVSSIYGKTKKPI